MKMIDNRIFFDTIITPPHECSYLPNRWATTVLAEPFSPKEGSLYDNLVLHGFRRTGEQIYRPFCQDCQACFSVRLPVELFAPRRSQRRVWRKNQDLTVSAVTPVFAEEHFNLYCRYLASRHKDGNMDNPTVDDYMQFLTSSWSKTVFYEFRLKKQLLILAVVDYLENGLSAVYTFFEPNERARSLGVYGILWEIEEVKRLNLKWLYLGYWIKDCQKMSYKAEYQPLEYYDEGRWLMVNG
jgi:arginine-tRNA-protein transferase